MLVISVVLIAALELVRALTHVSKSVAVIVLIIALVLVVLELPAVRGAWPRRVPPA